ncbi:MAG: hypothetical protein OIF32_10825 [Campylobacterales bacterium]|nr:hypothetical protein [Campylobacterales bacterium]
MKKIIFTLAIISFLFIGCTTPIEESDLTSYSMKVGEVINVSREDKVVPDGSAIVDVSYVKETGTKTVTLVSGSAKFVFGIDKN